MPEALPVFEIGLVLLAAALAGALVRRIGLPAVLGYLAVGLAVGPFTPGYVADPKQIRILADVGVVLLLFEVGGELDLRELRREPPTILVAAPVQVALTALAAALALGGLGLAVGAAATLGLAVALSSSVVVVNMARSRRRTMDDATGRALVVWAILQDVVSLVAIPLLAVLLASAEASAAPAALAKLAAFALLALAAHNLVIPRLLGAVRDQPDTFLMVAVSMALLTAGIGSIAFGVPLALAAFVAGLALSLRPEAKEARREVLPFRDLFAAMFFVAIGTLLDPATIPANLGWIALGLALVALKGILSAVLCRVSRVPARAAQLGVGLAQIGEFSFIVLAIGVSAGAVTSGQFSALLTTAVASIAISTIAVRAFPRAPATAT